MSICKINTIKIIYNLGTRMFIIKTRKNLNIPEKGARYFPHTLEKVYPNTGITYSH